MPDSSSVQARPARGPQLFLSIVKLAEYGFAANGLDSGTSKTS
jgi:hypothetical protein